MISLSSDNTAILRLDRRPGGGGRGGYSIYLWVGRCGAVPHTLTLFKTNIADFPTLFKTDRGSAIVDEVNASDKSAISQY